MTQTNAPTLRTVVNICPPNRPWRVAQCYLQECKSDVLMEFSCGFSAVTLRPISIELFTFVHGFLQYLARPLPGLSPVLSRDSVQTNTESIVQFHCNFVRQLGLCHSTNIYSRRCDYRKLIVVGFWGTKAAHLRIGRTLR